MKITFRDIQGYDGLTKGVCNEMVLIRFDINRHVKNSFCYLIPKLKYYLILGIPDFGKTMDEKEWCSILS